MIYNPRCLEDHCNQHTIDEFHRHLYCTEDATPGGTIQVKHIGPPNADPVWLCVGSGVVDPALNTPFGPWHLDLPLIGPLALTSIPPDGVLPITSTVPLGLIAPAEIPIQALIGEELTNLYMLEVQ
ncbi:MAG: hypothetical protein ABIK28_00025 [Planctomycetota bacterium]